MGSACTERGSPQAIRVEVGREGFEPPKSEDNRFTVCPLWPLGYLPGVEGFIKKCGKREAGASSRAASSLVRLFRFFDTVRAVLQSGRRRASRRSSSRN